MAKILVIEDEPSVRFVIQSAIEALGHEVVAAENGEAGLELIDDHLFDIVVTDILMPLVDGLEVILKVKRERPATKIIAISGGGNLNFNYESDALAFGAEKYLSKPFTDSDLIDAVTRCLPDPGHA